ncbi:FAD-linked oxidase C-terminal domain-containing protein [Motiliproteus sediminis]|uniref:FAD-linked oxidase C-terminal domain-containing protein n=1 Tax=Motiliproteus sediminis TaxID=1468178 RepID=UPI001AEFAAE3|nr:FAD-linked oxidase C-terminal domain-containing protein [Motiliproteus sediminis]
MHQSRSPDTQRAAKLAPGFRTLIGSDAVLLESEDQRPFECDGLPVYRQLPLLTLLPADEQEVRDIMRYCHEQGIAVVPRGAATGLSGGALPHPDAVLLSLTRLNRIIAIDPVAGSARVQPGVRNLAISEAAAAYGLYYAPDPSSQIACTIGGNVAENSGGVHCLKYGLTVHNLLKLTLVTPEGERLELGSDAPDTPGYDLMALLTGSEGMFGVVVEITVKLLPLPPCTRVALADFTDIKRAGDAVGAIIAAGIIPAGLEMMDQLAIAAVEDFVHAGYPRDAAAILLCELDGSQAEVDAQMKQVCRVLKQQGARQVRLARDEAERLLFWKGRKTAFPALGRIAADYYCMDGTIPRSHLAAVLTRIAELSAEYGLPVANVFHAGDGNLHPLILYDANQPGELERTEELGGRILELCIEVGGSITGEHGVGMEKLKQMCAQFTDAELAQFRQLRDAFDPDQRMNPGKAVPDLKRCAEYRALAPLAGAQGKP